MTEERKSTTWSGIGILILVLIVIAIVAYVALNPSILEDIVGIIIIAVIVLIVIGVIIVLAMGLLAVPYYIKKGETHQTDMKYDIKDVKSVKEKLDPEDKSEDKPEDKPKSKDEDLQNLY
ncbi:MAG: hypothetical protein KRP56_07085 [Candidatus Methanogranum gryphiswaldense]|nr:MAG: hypothetical protein KRP56_07085 [Candidatus Methanogranum sp. U3.2.1]